MNPFQSMLNDTVFVVNKTGTRFGPYKTAVASKNGKFKADIFETSLEVEDGDRLVRRLPGDKEEVYTIIAAQFHSGHHVIPSFWDLALSKGTAAPQMHPPKTTINISHSQGIQIGDHNVQHIANSLQGLIEKLDASTASVPEKRQAKNLFRQLFENPTVSGILGAATGSLIGLLRP